MIMVIQLMGVPNAKIHPPKMIFKKYACSYPNLGVNKDVLGVSYTSIHWGWMDRGGFTEWLKEK